MMQTKFPPRQTKEDFYGYNPKPRPKKRYTPKPKIIEIEELQEKKIETDIQIIKKKKRIKKGDLKRVSRIVARSIKEDVKQCEQCSRSDVNLEVHHKNRDVFDNSEDNIIKLCVYCHYEIHKDEPVGRIMRKRLGI